MLRVEKIVGDSASEALLIAVDADMKQLAKQFRNEGERFKKLSMVLISCISVMALKRFTQAFSTIEHEWHVGQKKGVQSLWLEIANHRLTTYC